MKSEITRRGFFSASWLLGLFSRKKEEPPKRYLVVMHYDLSKPEGAKRTIHKVEIPETGK
jgi:hypothetical protein